MALSEEAQEQINEAVRIVAEDRLWSAISSRLAPTDPTPAPQGPDDPIDDGKPGPPPPRLDDDADGTVSKAKPGAWWGEIAGKEEAS